MSRSPMYSLFNEVLNGLITIRAYEKQDAFIARFFELADHQTRNFFVFYYSNRWLAIRLDSFVLLSVALLATGLATAGNIVNGNYLGLALVYALQLTGLLQWTVRIATETETNMTSVERLLQFNSIQPEEIWVSNEEWVETIRQDSSDILKERRGVERPIVEGVPKYVILPRNGSEEPDATIQLMHWPTHGNIDIINLRMRYRPELGLVLKGLNIFVPGGKRVGICGRTGAGKSSLMLALFRIVQFEKGSRVLVDGRDISEISLAELRSSLTIIPQDPVMFSGTLRSNLDPFSKHSEVELWEALERAHLKEDIIMKFPKKLDHEVSE
jgi:ABC-type multidrug transport system fused ATPase/permease subunit